MKIVKHSVGFIMLFLFLVTSCVSLGPLTTASVTGMKETAIEKPVYKKVYLYVEAGTGKMVKSDYRPPDYKIALEASTPGLPKNTTKRIISEVQEYAGTETVSGFLIQISTG
jgi:hypothetical protein